MFFFNFCLICFHSCLASLSVSKSQMQIRRKSTVFSEPPIIPGQPLKTHFTWNGIFSLKYTRTELIGCSDGEERIILSGHTALTESGDGVMENLQFMREHEDLQNARENSLPCVEILGGPWLFENCRIQSQGGAAVFCNGKNACIQLERCSVGGSGPGRLRAGEGLSAHGLTSANISTSEFIQCLAAVVAVDNARVCLDSTSFSEVSYALCVDGHGCLSARSCAATRVTLGLLFAGSDASFASLELAHTTANAARLWFGGGRPGISRFENNTVHVGGGHISMLQMSSKEREAAARVCAAMQEEPLQFLAEYPGQ
jgi:hypothetical protein